MEDAAPGVEQPVKGDNAAASGINKEVVKEDFGNLMDHLMGDKKGGRRRSKRRYGKKGAKKSRKGAKQSKKGGRRSSKNRRKHSHRSRKH